MRTERFTTRANEAIAAAQQLAEGEGNPELTALHLLLSLVDQPDGVVPAAIERMGKDPAALADAVRAELAKLPKVSGGAQLTLGDDARRILSDAHLLAERMHDDYVSTEHLLLAIIEDAAGQAFHDRGLADARLADEHRVVLRAARQHLDDAADLLVAPDHRIELASPRQLREVAAVPFEGLIRAFGVLARDAL